MLGRLQAWRSQVAIPGWFAWFIRLAAAAALFLVSALHTLPLVDGEHYHYGHIDNILFIFTMEWTRYALFSEPQRFFEGLMYFGMGDSVFYTHLLLGGLPIYAPVAAIFGPGVGINVLTIASPILNASAATAAAWILLRRWWPSVIAGFIFAFAPIQQEFFQFHHMLMFWWTPLAMMCWFSFLQRPRWWKFGGAWLCVFIQLATGIYLGFIALVTLLALVIAALVSGRLQHLDRRLIARSGVATVVAALPFIPLLVGYVGFWLDNQEVRTLEEARTLSARLPEYLPAVVQSHVWFQELARSVHGLTPTFPIIVPSVLALLGLVAGIARRPRAVAIALGITGLLMFALSLGPELWWDGERTDWSLPYSAAHALIPGFASMRTPGLFAAGMVLAMAFLAAIAVARFSCWRRAPAWVTHLMAVALVGILFAEFARVSVSAAEIPYEPELQDTLAQLPDGPVAFVPGAPEFLPAEEGVRRAWWSLNGGRQPVISGYSGYEPRGTAYLARLTNWATAGDRRQVLDALIAFGMRTIVLDRQFMTFDQVAAWQATIQAARPSAHVDDGERFVVSYLGPEEVPAAAAWSDVEIQPVLRQTAHADSDIVVSIAVRNLADRPWRPPPGRRTRTGDLVWESPPGTTSSRQPILLRVPPIIPAGATVQALELLAIRTPESPGKYRLRMSIEGNELSVRDIEIHAQAAVDSRPPLAADLRALELPACIPAGESVRVQVEALNSGVQPWGPTQRLGARWSTPDDRFVPQPLEKLEARLLTPHDIHQSRWLTIGSGSVVVYEGSVQAPSHAGPYTLTLGMVEEGVGWFGEIEVPVIVIGASDAAAC